MSLPTNESTPPAQSKCKCGQCAKVFSFPIEHLGKKARCPQCGEKITLIAIQQELSASSATSQLAGPVVISATSMADDDLPQIHQATAEERQADELRIKREQQQAALAAAKQRGKAAVAAKQLEYRNQYYFYNSCKYGGISFIGLVWIVTFLRRMMRRTLPAETSQDLGLILIIAMIAITLVGVLVSLYGRWMIQRLNQKYRDDDDITLYED
jgi:DNA-directed RNA polymerase subunit RPC12/RpoP